MFWSIYNKVITLHNESSITSEGHAHVDIPITDSYIKMFTLDKNVFTAFGHIYCHDDHATQYAWQSDGTVWKDKSHEYDLIEAPNFEIIHNTKIINYFGKSYETSINTKYITTDGDGIIKCHTINPQISSLQWISDPQTMEYIDKIKYTGNWKESLICL